MQTDISGAPATLTAVIELQQQPAVVSDIQRGADHVLPAVIEPNSAAERPQSIAPCGMDTPFSAMGDREPGAAAFEQGGEQLLARDRAAGDGIE